MNMEVMQLLKLDMVYLKQLDENGLQTIRQKISKESNMLIDKKAHPMAGELMSILCEPDIISALSVDQLMKMIESIFPGTVLEEG